MKSLFIIITILLSFPIVGKAQEPLTIEDAIALALDHNFDIQLSQNSVEEAENNSSIYNSGFLPSAAASGNLNYANNNSKLTDQSNVERKIEGIQTKGYGASVSLNYVLFNGGARKYKYDNLKSLYELSNSQKQIQIENTLIDVYTTFYNMARNQEQLNTMKEAYAISKERVERLEANLSYGQSTTLDVLNARVDANADSINLINVDVLVQNNRRSLNFLLGRDVNTPFVADKSVVLDEALSYETLLEQLRSQNNELKQMEIYSSISAQDLKINQAGWLPSVSTSVGYGINYNDNGPAGFFAVQQSNGLNAGLSLSWNIFDGGTTKVKVQNAKIALKTQEINRQKLTLNLENQLANYWAEYNTQKAIMENEKINIEISNQNFLKSKELFNLGKITSLDFRQAQLNLINTKLTLLNATYNAKIAELQLKKFAGFLVD